MSFLRSTVTTLSMKTLILLFSLIFGLTACIKNNPDPSWIQVNEWQLTVNPNSQNPTGVLTENITDAWVFIDNEIVGVFEVPFKVPVLYEGSSNILIYPAIRNNGISATKKIYPFLEPYELNTNLVKNEILIIDPTTQYYDQVDFWIEDFEDATVDIVDGPTSLVSLERTNDITALDNTINEGFYGRVTLDQTNSTWIGSTVANNNGSIVMNLPKGQEVYLEIDYHNTNSLLTGVLAINSLGGATDNPNIQLNPQSESEVYWKKIYIDLREIVSGSVSADYFEFSFQSLLDEGETSGVVNIDNIKAVYF